jgi:serine/threonine protein kinase
MSGEMPKLKKGDVIGEKYEVRDFLGEGGFSDVYLVYSKEIKELLALKTIRDDKIRDPLRRARIKQEAIIWVKLGKHPYLVQLKAAEEIDGRLWIGLEPIINPNNKDLRTLEGYLNRGELEFLQVIKWAIQFCIGIEYAYQMGLKAHRDITPSNILITQDRQLKISDFGLAGVLEEISQEGQIDGQSPKITKKMIGTDTHMSPEQFDNPSECDERSDIYSFGIVLYQMINDGNPPFLHGSWDEKERLHKESPVAPLDSELFPIISKCLEKDPQKRYRSFEELRFEFQTILKEKTGEIIEIPTKVTYEIHEFTNWATCFSNLNYDEEAIEKLDKALELDENNIPALRAKGVCLNKLGKYEEALEYINKVIELDPTDVNALSHKIACYIQLHEYQKAEQFYSENFKQLSKFPDAIHHLGRSYQDLNLHEEAIEYFDEALKHNPIEPSQIYNSKGISLRVLRQYNVAIGCFKKAIEFNPIFFKAYNDLGVCYTSLPIPKYIEAIACFDFIIRQYEMYPDPVSIKEVLRAWSNKGVCYIRLNRLEESKDCFDKALALDSSYIIALFNKAETFSKQGDPERSIESLEKTFIKLKELGKDAPKEITEEKILQLISTIRSKLN